MTISLHIQPERRFIHSMGTTLHIDFRLHVSSLKPQQPQRERMPLTLSCVVDRSGSMSGEKIMTAKRALLSVLDRLNSRDQLAVVVFDDQIDVLQERAAVTADNAKRIRKALSAIEARGSTALHEGWLTGCNTIASETAHKQGLARCFLLTDGLANVGLTDPEAIATQAAGIRRETGIGTSTFGIGNNYNEALLGPLAVAGGGQFHHLRTAAEIAQTFLGELGEMLSVSVSQVRLEIEVEWEQVRTELVSAYWEHAAATRRVLTIGDLQSDEERHIVLSFAFPAQQKRDGTPIRARLLWVADGKEQVGDWQEFWFSYVDQAIYDKEQPDPQVTRQIALQRSDQARREALKANQQQDYAGAQAYIQNARHYVQAASQAAPDIAEELADEVQGLQQLEIQVGSAMPAAPAKEAYYQAQKRSRLQRDHREQDQQK